MEFYDFSTSLDASALQSLLVAAAAIIREQVADHGPYARSPGSSFAYDLGGGVEVEIWKRRSFPSGPSWKTLETIVYGLSLYMVQGNRPRAVKFRFLIPPNNLELGYGVIKQSHAFSSRTIARDLPLRLRPKDPSGSGSDLTNTSLLNSNTSHPSVFLSSIPKPLTVPRHFHIPHTDMNLRVIAKRQFISPVTMRALLNAAYARTVDQITVHGRNTPVTRGSFLYRDDSSRLFLEVTNSRLPSDKMTWGQVATAVQGLSQFMSDSGEYRACFFSVYKGEPVVEIGFGQIDEGLVTFG